MNSIRLYVHTDENRDGNWVLQGQLDFAPMDTQWMLEGKLPEEHNIIPWQTFTMPSGEEITIGIVFDDPAKSLALHVKTATQPVLEIIGKGQLYLRFLSPAGTDVSFQTHEIE